MEVTGPRGKSAFARLLGLPASTYDYYESGRVPPAEILVKIAEVARVNVCWLLTGETHCDDRIGAASPILQRAARLLKDSPQAAGALSALLDILEQTGKFPRKPASDQAIATEANEVAPPAPNLKPTLTPTGHSQLVPADTGQQPGNREQWIPVLGRTAAG
ncbi:MAG: helix-turn-helix domain-containing protein, partial [Phycisphaerae bacterium]